MFEAGLVSTGVPDLNTFIPASGCQPALDLRMPVTGKDVVRVGGPPLLALVRLAHVPQLNLAVLGNGRKLPERQKHS